MRLPWQKKEKWQLSKLFIKGLYAGTARIRLNPAIKESDYPYLVELSLNYEGKMPNSQEFDRFEAIEERMQSMELDKNFLMVFCATHDNVREWFFYARNAEQAVSALQAEFHDENPLISSEPDPQWTSYHDIFHRLRQ